jgi:hypothetical protein
VTFGAPGWHRIKADAGAGGAIRSNRLDVCVVSAPGGSCGAAPSDTLPREAAPLPPDPVAPPTGETATTPVKPGDGTTPAKLVGAPVIELPHFTSAGQKTGRVGVRWRILQAGVGVRRWRFSARPAGSGKAYRSLLSGTKGTSALLKLGAGRTWTVSATFTDTLGRDVSQTVGDVLVPLDAGAKSVHRDGSWTRVPDAGAWLGAVHRGRAGATLTATLAAGRPTVQLRGVRKATKIEVRVGSKRVVYRISGSTTTGTREIVAARRGRGGAVGVRIVSGTAGVDGLGVRP